jgi:hypothetical protein
VAAAAVTNMSRLTSSGVIWALIYSKAHQMKLLYEVCDGTWTQRSSADGSISNGTPFTMAIDYLGSGGVWGYTATIPAGQVGLWCSDSSDNDFDDFAAFDHAGPYEIDGRWFCNTGNVRVDDSNNNVLETYGSYDGWRTIIRRGFRADN